MMAASDNPASNSTMYEQKPWNKHHETTTPASSGDGLRDIEKQPPDIATTKNSRGMTPDEDQFVTMKTWLVVWVSYSCCKPA